MGRCIGFLVISHWSLVGEAARCRGSPGCSDCRAGLFRYFFILERLLLKPAHTVVSRGGSAPLRSQCALGGSPRCSTWRRVKRVECDCRAGFTDYLSLQTEDLSFKPARTVVSSSPCPLVLFIPL